MNLTLHLIRKDLHYFRAALVAWLVSLVLFAGAPSVRFSGVMNLRDFLQVFGLLMVVVIFVALLGGIIQVDHPTDGAASWRTRPISPLRLLGAKLLLIGVIFVVLPMLVIIGSHVSGSVAPFQEVREYGFVMLLLASLALSYAATSACTRSLVFSLMLWLGVVFASGTVADWMGRTLPKLRMRASAEMMGERALAIMSLSVVLSLVILANQYLRRRLSVSIVCLVIGAVGTALIGILWNYYYFYQG